MSDQQFVPDDFAVPAGLTAEEFRLEPLGPEHNAADYAAWTASIGHIRATPGFPWGSWPHEMSLAENLRDLERHAGDFASRRGFTYTVLSIPAGEVIGCVYIYPPPGQNLGHPGAGGQRAAVRSWVRADRAALDPVLYRAVRAWLERDWPFGSIEYAPRDLPGAAPRGWLAAGRCRSPGGVPSGLTIRPRAPVTWRHPRRWYGMACAAAGL
jgi:hypothetical protein